MFYHEAARGELRDAWVVLREEVPDLLADPSPQGRSWLDAWGDGPVKRWCCAT